MAAKLTSKVENLCPFKEANKELSLFHDLTSVLIHELFYR